MRAAAQEDDAVAWSHAFDLYAAEENANGVVVSARQVITVEDHGSALRPAHLAELGGPAPPDDLLTGPPVRGPGMTVQTRPEANGSVSVTGPWGTCTVSDATGVADQLITQVTLARLDAEVRVPRLHAGAVVDGDGRAALLLGMSGAGKSTLVAHLVAGGHALLNDEQVSVHADAGLLGGFTRPIAVKPGGTAHLPEGLRSSQQSAAGRLLPATALGGQVRTVGRPGLIVILDREGRTASGHMGRPELAPGQVLVEPLEHAETLIALCDNNLDLVSRPSAGLDGLGWLAATVPAVRIRYEETADAARVVADLLRDPPTCEAVPWNVIDPEPTGSCPARGQVVAHPEVWCLELGTKSVVLRADTRVAVRLNASGTKVWRSLPHPASQLDPFLTELADHGLVVIEDQDPMVRGPG